MRHVLPFALLFSLLAGCATKSTQRSAPVALALRCPDTIEIASKSGADYVSLIRKCALRDRIAMSELFRLTKTGHFDGASSEGNAAVLGSLLTSKGDSFFGDCLSCEPVDVQDEVRDNILFDLGWNGEIASRVRFNAQYPRTLPLVLGPQ